MTRFVGIVLKTQANCQKKEFSREKIIFIKKLKLTHFRNACCLQ